MSLKKAMQAAAKTYKKNSPAKKKAAAKKKSKKKTNNPAKVEFTSKITIEVGTIVYVKSRNIDVLEMSFKEGKTPTDGTVIEKFRATKIDKDGTVHFKGEEGSQISPSPAYLKHFLELGLGIKNGHSRVSAWALGTKMNPYKSIRRNGKTITGRTRAKKYLRRTGALGVYYQNKSGDIHRLSWTQ